MHEKENQRIFISGASRGIGAQLALAYAQENVVLGLLARNEEKLKNVALACQKKKATVFTYTADVTDFPKIRNICLDFVDKAGGIDIVIANAGMATGPSRKGLYASDRLCEVVNTNCCGAIFLLNEFLPIILNQKEGTLVAISSVASFLPFLPGSYAASKVALNYFMEGLRLRHETKKIRFVTICPGYVATDMTSHYSKLPFVISSEKAAKKIISAINKGRRLYIFPAIWRFVILIAKLMPGMVRRYLLK
ncbi:MAG: SDR family NAD(P)-dependent oxidoreductase [Leptospiraceae bacterium]|nr:SDR family NAD(P)-dependent oxidoreductase [Leptospiraceae bacterium]MDW8306115.1 SDR family NAD(P)-dependent oxidoreductase [Leptospiraceae bacterium]